SSTSGLWCRARWRFGASCRASTLPSSASSPRALATDARSRAPCRATSSYRSRRPSRADLRRRHSASQNPPRVSDRDLLDLGVGRTGVADARQERLLQVRVAVAAVAGELTVVADVLRQEDPVGVAPREQLAQQLDDAAFPVTLHRGEAHAHEVEFKIRSPPDDLEVVVE